MKSFALFSALLLMMIIAHAAPPTAPAAPPSNIPFPEIPRLAPATSTGFVCLGENDSPSIVAVVVTYSDGAVLRFDAKHMHGFDVQELMVYSDTAPDSRVYSVHCLLKHTPTT